MVSASGDLPDFTKALLLLGADPNGALVPVLLDVDGRLSAFVVDSSDVWEQIVTIGNAELASRLGSLMTYDRRGQLLFQTDFSRGLEWFRLEDNPNSWTYEIDSEHCQTGGFSLRVDSPEAADQLCSFGLYDYVAVSGKVGIEIAFSCSSAATKLELWIGVYDGTNYHIGALQYLVADGNLAYLNSSYVFTLAKDGPTKSVSPDHWEYLKLVIDTDNDLYERVLWNASAIDVSSNALYAGASSAEPRIYVTLIIRSITTPAVSWYIDRAILTVSE